MTDDIVKRLRDHPDRDHQKGCEGRNYSCDCGYDSDGWRLHLEASDEIEHLRGEVERLRKSPDSGETERLRELRKLDAKEIEMLRAAPERWAALTSGQSSPEKDVRWALEEIVQHADIHTGEGAQWIVMPSDLIETAKLALASGCGQSSPDNRTREALERICAVQLDEPPPITDPDWKARLMQGIAREAIATQSSGQSSPDNEADNTALLAALIATTDELERADPTSRVLDQARAAIAGTQSSG